MKLKRVKTVPRPRAFISEKIFFIREGNIKIWETSYLILDMDPFSLEINVRIKNNIIKYNGKRYK